MPGALLLAGVVTVQTAGLAAEPGAGSTVQGHRDQAALDLHHRWTFDTGKPGAIPAGFSMLTIGAGPAGKWEIEDDPQAPSAPNRLTQSPSCSDADAAGCLQVLLAEGINYEYADLSIRLRMISEKAHGGGGIAFKARDARNFYAAIVDLAGDTLEVIRLVDGRPTVLGQVPVTRKPVDWHTLRVQHNTILSKDFLEITFDGQIVFSRWEKVVGGGQIGLVTKGAGIVGFDNFDAIQLYSQQPLSPPAAY